jgi:SAM-dependent methyltransferase
MQDIRADAAKFYDLNPQVPDDIPFYIERLPVADARVLELGCGTARVAIPLAAHCASIHGLDRSPAMVQIGKTKIAEAGLMDRIHLEVADISSFELSGRFDYVIAPFRVLQNLESDAEVDGLLRCIREQLEPSGRCTLNVFLPNRDPDAMRTDWVCEDERFAWEVETADGVVRCYEKRARVDAERLVLYPELIYRRFKREELIEEAVLRFAMRCYYPDEFVSLIEARGFTVFDKWGGYHGEAYGEGGELVIEFGVDA